MPIPSIKTNCVRIAAIEGIKYKNKERRYSLCHCDTFATLDCEKKSSFLKSKNYHSVKITVYSWCPHYNFRELKKHVRAWVRN